MYDEKAIRGALVQYFETLFTSLGPLMEDLNSISSYPAICDEDRQLMGEPVSMDEFKRVLFSIGNYKAHGPDGNHPLFFKAKWDFDPKKKAEWDLLDPSIFNFVLEVFDKLESIGPSPYNSLTKNKLRT